MEVETGPRFQLGGLGIAVIDNEVVRSRINLYTSYRVRFPDGKDRIMRGDRVLSLPHWKHCRVRLPGSAAITFILRQKDFLFGRSHVGTLSRYLEAKEVLLKEESRLIAAQAMVTDHRDDLLGRKRQFLESIRLVRSTEKFWKENIREALLKSPDILDVRFTEDDGHADGAPAQWFNGFIGGNYIESDEMLVTFIGPSIRVQHGVCPLPPVQVIFTANGTVKGGKLCIHPHIITGDACLGTAGNGIEGIAQTGDIYAAVDLIRVYLLGYDHTSPLVPMWMRLAWDWWATKFSQGWPEEEPFMKPWISEGLLVKENVTGRIITLSKVLGASDPQEMMNAIHIGLDNGSYSRRRYADSLSDVKLFALAATKSLCNCGRELDTPSSSVACVCHGSVSCCVGCLLSSGACRCVALSGWELVDVDRHGHVYCEFTEPTQSVNSLGACCGVRGNEVTPQVPMYENFRGNSAGPRFICWNHHPDYVMEVEDDGQDSGFSSESESEDNVEVRSRDATEV